jgi:aspartate/glutamate racemase
LWTVTTIKSWLYWNNLFKEGIKDVYIDDDIMLEKINNIIKKIIWWIKKFDEFDIKVLEKSISILKDKWATGVILWCTELPIAFESLKIDFQLYDPLLLTVKKACKIYYNN